MKKYKEFSLEASSEIDQLFSYMGLDSYEVAKHLVETSHRTVQQSIMRFCWMYITAMAECKETGRHDLRNEDSVKFACEVVEAIDTHHFPYI